ncbi:MAG: ComEC/Rec2 family competence protein, partial [Planctomycetes bacterium]|nr:ComEC/Rec2 family competence protein [Planctomycetota bacterium]
ALLCHLVLGGGPAVAAELTQAHRATGVSHLLAVSGAHLTMLAWRLGFTFTLATRRSALGNRWFHTVCSAVLVLYGAITGMDPPVFRALVATSVFLLGTSAGRRVPVSGLLALPALLTALFAPRDLLGVSFNLSYAAVVGLFLSGGLRGGGWRERYWIGPLQCSVWAALCTMPLTLWYFGQWAPWTIVATPLLGPLVAAMLGLGLTTTLAAPVWAGFGWILAWPLSAMTALYCGAVQLLSRLPLAPVLAESRPSLPLLMCAGLLGTACLLWLRDRRGVVALCLSLSLPHFLPAPQPVEPGLVLVAVGHGHAGLLRLPDGTTVLVDCGSLRQPHRAAQAIARVVLPHYHIDWLVVTHGDHDHINAIPQLLARVRPRQALLPLELRGSTIESLLQRNGCTIRWLAAGARCRPCAGVLVHRPATRGNRNDQSAWVHAELGSFRAILTGDALVAGVAAWLASDLSTPADVLVLPHHGRPHDGIAPLLQRVRPRLALVSCAGRDGFTAQGKLARAAGCSVLHTGSSGTITVRASAPPTIHTERPWPVE